MAFEEYKADDPKRDEKSINLENLLEERERLEQLIKNKFTRKITVMFTDFKGSTSIAESKGDMFSRMLIKKHNDIVFPLIDLNRGTLVKTMGDGTLSYFENASDALGAAVSIQKEISKFNASGQSQVPIQLRIGMHTGTGIVEKNDIFGDVVNVASRFESIAAAEQIFVSESTIEALDNKDSFLYRHVQTTKLKGKTESFHIYKVYWNELEMEKDRQLQEDAAAAVSALELNKISTPPDSADQSFIVQKALKFRESNELLEMYLYCEEFKQVSAVNEIYQKLKGELEQNGKTDTLLNGKKTVWFFKDMISMGRVPEADFPITNQAFARVPIIVGIRNGEGVFKIESRTTGKVHATELHRGSRTETLKPDVEYTIGKDGKIIFAVCFPFEYRCYKNRFLVLNMLDPDECIQSKFNYRLKDIWKDFRSESEKFIVIGQ
jgi:class 3 adenylate cyclase